MVQKPPDTVGEVGSVWASGGVERFPIRRPPMSLRLQPLPPVPDDTARIAQAAFRRGNPYVLLRDRLGAVFADADFADLYPKLGQPAYAPWRLALVTLMQFREGLSDRQAAEAVRGRIDWKYLLALDLADAGFDFSVLCEFRTRLLHHEATERLLARVLDAARDDGLLKARGRQRTDSTHMLAAVRDLNRLELLGETLRAALNAIASTAPDWLHSLAPPEWHARYDRRVEDVRLPDAGPKRDAYAVQVGADGFLVLHALDGAQTPAGVRDLPEVGVLRRVWARHFERDEAGSDGSGSAGERPSRGVRLRPAQGRGPGERVESPYDTEARFRAKAGTNWTGYMTHFTETCDADAALDRARRGHAGQRARGDAHRADPRRAGRRGADPVRTPGRRGLRQRRPHRRGPRAPPHRPDRPRAAGPELAEAGGGRVSRHRLRGGLGQAGGALPRGQGKRGLGRLQGQGLGPLHHPGR